MAARPRFSSPAQAIRASAALDRAVVAAGGPARLAQALGLARLAVPRWTFCPAQHVDAIAAASGVFRHDLRSDLYPAPTGSLTAAERALPAHLAAGAFFARTGRCLSSVEGRA